MEPEIKKILAELRENLTDLYGDRLLRVIVFGSQAREDSELGSDIDVMVVLEGDVLPGKEIMRTSEIRAGLSLKHGKVISCVFMSSSRYANEQSPLLMNARREGLII